MEKKKESIIWGIIIVIIGVLFLGNNLNFWNINIFFDGWWTLFIIIPSVMGLFNRNTLFSSILGILIGLLMLYATQDIISWHQVGGIFVPVLIIMIGISILFKPKKIKCNHNKNDLPEYIGIFSGSEEKINDEFKGANCVAVFGGIELDLRNASIKEDVTIECVTVFGGIDLLVPDDVIVKTNGTPIFGGVENKNLSTNEKHTLYINYVCVFGGIDIK